MVVFGTNVDLSDEEIWCKQLQELNKLPPFLRVSLISTAVCCHCFKSVFSIPNACACDIDLFLPTCTLHVHVHVVHFMHSGIVLVIMLSIQYLRTCIHVHVHVCVDFILFLYFNKTTL